GEAFAEARFGQGQAAGGPVSSVGGVVGRIPLLGSAWGRTSGRCWTCAKRGRTAAWPRCWSCWVGRRGRGGGGPGGGAGPGRGGGSPASRSRAAPRGRKSWPGFRCGASGTALDLWVAATRQPRDPAVLELDRGRAAGSRGSRQLRKKDSEAMHDP